jgi:uroporphyrinogen decarboxylase
LNRNSDGEYCDYQIYLPGLLEMIMDSYERVTRTLNHQESDRIPRSDSYWPEVVPQWRNEGLPADANVSEIFDFDIVGAGWANSQAKPGFTETIEENDQWITRKDGNGAILRYWKNKSGTPEHVGFTVNSRESWAAHKRELLSVPISKRVDAKGAFERMRQARQKHRWFCWAGVECFEIAKDVLGHEQLCIAMAEDPEWAKDVFDTKTDVAINVLNYLEASGLKFDGAWIYGDIAFNTAPFCSPAMYRELVMPAHKRHVGWFKERGLPVIYHTDGNFTPLIPSMLEIGIDCFQPLEAKAGMDVRNLKRNFGNAVSFMGNIDATVLLTNDHEKIEAEVASKIPAAKAGGGYIYHSDHSIPPGVTWQTYQFVMQLVDRYGAY